MRSGSPPRAPRKANLEYIARRLADPWEPSARELLIKELEAQGLGETEIAKELALHDQAETIEVLAENMESVEVYTRCQWTVVGIGMSGLAEVGISSQEIESACRLCNIPNGRWADIAMNVRIMANAAGPIRNRKHTGKRTGDDDFGAAAAAHVRG